MTARSLGIALPIALAAWQASALAAGEAPVLRPGETVRLEMPPGDPQKTSVTLELLATEDGPLTVETSTLYFDTLLNVFEMGAPDDAQPLAEDDDGGLGGTSANSRLTFEAAAGRSYRVEVRGNADAWGGPFEVSAARGTPAALDAEERRRRDAEYWDAVAAEAQRTDSAILESRALLGRGSLHVQAAEYVEARPLYERALAIYEKVHGPEHPSTAVGLSILANLLKAMGEYASARPLFERALAIREKVLGPEHPDTAQGLNNLASLLAAIGEYASARPLYERALAINEKVHGPEHLDTAGSLNNLAGLLHLLGEYASARPLYERALAVFEKVHGPEHPNTAVGLNNLARLLQTMGEYASARPLYERALAINEKVRGPEHPDTARSLSNLASLLRAMGEHASARPLYERALAINEKVHGPEHPDTAMSLNDLAVLLQAMGEYPSARPLYERALAINEKVHGPEHPETAKSLNNLASLLQATGEYATARPLYERALAINEKVHGPEHPETAKSLNNLAYLLQATGEYVTARPLYERALTINEKVHGPEHPYTAVSLVSLAGLLQGMGEYASARPLHERALAILEKVHGPEHPETAASLNNLASLLEAMGEYASAQPLYERALEIREKGFGPEHPYTATVLNSLARLLQAIGEYASARPLYERALAIREKVHGPEHPYTATTLAGLAGLYRALDERGPAMEAALRAETIGAAHLAKTARTMSEEGALRYAAVRPRGLGLALTLLAAGGDVGPQAVEVWEAAMATRGQVLDEVASRRQRLNATVRAARELGQAAGDLANLMVRGAGAPELEAARRRQERAEQAVARSARAGSEAWTPPALREVALGLPTDAALVAFVRYDRLPPSSKENKGKATPAYAAFVLNKGEVKPAFVDLGSAEPIDEAVRAWKREASRGVVEASAGEALARYRAAGEALRKLAWDPLAPHLARARKIFVVADGTLQLVSFAALPSGEAGYLVEAAPWIHYLSAERDLIARPGGTEKTEGLLALGGPSFDEASLFAALGKKKEAGDGAVLVASAVQAAGTDAPTFRGERSGCADFRALRFEPLPGTAREAEEIVGLWRTRERPSYLSAGQVQQVERSLELEGAAASETAFKAQAHGHRVLHLATHGFFLGSECASGAGAEGSRGIGAIAEAKSPAAPRLGENPLRLSGLALAGANRREAAGPGEDDGILTAEEIAALDLSGTEWVVLSACDTGVGDIKAGEGVFGLRRAFQVAGAGTLVMSLWSVDDEATRSWMKALYDARLNKRMDTAEAVRAAGLAVLEERRKAGESTHPFYWAAFVAAGDWR